MRTTVTLAPDVAAAVERLRREKALGVSDAVNELIRTGFVAHPAPEPYRPRTFDAGPRLDLINTGEVLEILEGPDHR